MNWQIWVVLTVVVATIAALAKNTYPAAVVMTFALMISWNCGIITSMDALSGFGNAGLMAVAALLIVVRGVEKSGILDLGIGHILGTTQSVVPAVVRLMIVVSFLSGFFNNTPLVAMLVPVVRDWARRVDLPPSKFLIPISFAAISGGTITIIGTSTNLVVQGLLKNEGLDEFRFFEPAMLSIPLIVLTVIYMAALGHRILPSSGGMLRLIRDRADDVLTELLVQSDFAYINQSLHLVLQQYFHISPASILKVRRRVVPPSSSTSAQTRCATSSDSTDKLHDESQLLSDRVDKGNAVDQEYAARRGAVWGVTSHTLQPNFSKDGNGMLSNSDQTEIPPQFVDILPVTDETRVQEADIIFLACPKGFILDWKRTKGLRLLDSNVMDLVGFGTELYEVVLSGGNPFLGQDLRQSLFAEHYKCSIVAYRPRNMFTQGDNAFDVNTSSNARPLQVGDTVLVVAKSRTELVRKDFLLVTVVGHLPGKHSTWDYVPVGLFVVMMGLVVGEILPMHQAAMSLAVIIMLGRWTTEAEAIQSVDMSLLVVIATSLGMSKAIEKSGLADILGESIKHSDMSPGIAIILLYTFCWIVTELVTNNAAAAISFPIAMALARNLGVSTKPFAAATMFAASTSFCTPYGYTTNLMVWGPGGYCFLDFVKVGLPLAIIHICVSSILIPLIWPF